jgi:hypothetical protein
MQGGAEGVIVRGGAGRLGRAAPQEASGIDRREEPSMIKAMSCAAAVAGCLAVLPATLASAAEMKVISDQAVKGFAHPEAVIYDPEAKVLYVGDFGADLKPADKDGKGSISKVSLDGKVLEKAFLPAPGQTLHKPKGMWVRGKRLWVSDIDAVWAFDLDTKQGKKLELPGIQFANDVAVMNGVLYVSDNRSDQLFRVEPADFLKSEPAPKVSVALAGKGVSPNGIYPAKDGTLLMVGFKSKDEKRAIYALAPGGDPKALSEPIGMLDGVHELADGDLLATDWLSGSLFRWSKAGGMQSLATGFKGPADFAVAPNGAGLLVVVPDLVQGDLRFVQLGK